MSHDPVLGDPRFAARIRAMRTKGNLVAWRRRWLERSHGAGAVAALAERLAPEAREYLLDPPAHFSWVSLGPLVELDRALVLGPMGGDVTKMRAFGREIGRGDLSTVYRLAVQLAVSPAMIPGRIARTWTSYFQPGEAFVQEAGARHALVGTTEPLPEYLCAQGISGWIEGALALAVPDGTGVEHVACVHRGDAGCRWRMWWP
jgi:hypothetical protein